jgi:predicted alpha/beta superfamily hydrolase
MTRITVFLAFCVLCISLGAQDSNRPVQPDSATINCGIIQKLYSKVLGEYRTLLIRLPEDYEKGDRYPVLYKLDGDKGVFLQTVSSVYYLVDMTDKIPDHIIVGVENTDRRRDMEPGPGAENFIKFFKEELIPFIEKYYRANNYSILSGQSYSALFTAYIFMKEPELFNAYILSSFALYNESLTGMYENELKDNLKLKNAGKRYLFVANAKKDSYDPDGSKTRRGILFLTSLKKSFPEVRIENRDYDDEGHVPFPSVYDGLKWIYSQEKYMKNK